MKETRIIGLMIKDRIKEAGRLQLLLTKNAHLINTRLGLHELNESKCSRVGVIVLHLTGNPKEWLAFEEEIFKIEGVEIQHMSFLY